MIPLTGLIPLHYSACPEAESGSLTSFSLFVFFCLSMFSELGLDMIKHCLCFLFKTMHVLDKQIIKLSIT